MSSSRDRTELPGGTRATGGWGKRGSARSPTFQVSTTSGHQVRGARGSGRPAQQSSMQQAQRRLPPPEGIHLELQHPTLFTHRNLRSGSGRKRLFIELARSTRTRTGTAEGRCRSGTGGGPRFHTTSTSPAQNNGAGQAPGRQRKFPGSPVGGPSTAASTRQVGCKGLV